MENIYWRLGEYTLEVKRTLLVMVKSNGEDRYRAAVAGELLECSYPWMGWRFPGKYIHTSGPVALSMVKNLSMDGEDHPRMKVLVPIGEAGFTIIFQPRDSTTYRFYV